MLISIGLVMLKDRKKKKCMTVFLQNNLDTLIQFLRDTRVIFILLFLQIQLYLNIFNLQTY